LTVFFFFGRGAIGDREYRKGKAQLIHVANVFRTTTKNKKLLAGGIQSKSSRSNCDVTNLVTTAKKKHNVMARNIRKLSFELLSQF
jgi:hypothetical protein